MGDLTFSVCLSVSRTSNMQSYGPCAKPPHSSLKSFLCWSAGSSDPKLADARVVICLGSHEFIHVQIFSSWCKIFRGTYTLVLEYTQICLLASIDVTWVRYPWMNIICNIFLTPFVTKLVLSRLTRFYQATFCLKNSIRVMYLINYNSGPIGCS